MGCTMCASVFRRKIWANRLFSKKWAGQTNDLAKISGVDDATFCHNSCFFVRAQSRYGVIKLCNLAMKGKLM